MSWIEDECPGLSRMWPIGASGFPMRKIVTFCRTCKAESVRWIDDLKEVFCVKCVCTDGVMCQVTSGDPLAMTKSISEGCLAVSDERPGRGQ